MSVLADTAHVAGHVTGRAGGGQFRLLMAVPLAEEENLFNAAIDRLPWRTLSLPRQWTVKAMLW